MSIAVLITCIAKINISWKIEPRLSFQHSHKTSRLFHSISHFFQNKNCFLVCRHSCLLQNHVLIFKTEIIHTQWYNLIYAFQYVILSSFQVSKVLNKYLTEDQYADYDHFIKMKAKLIMDAREIDDKIKLGEEQQKALRETMNKKQ